MDLVSNIVQLIYSGFSVTVILLFLLKLLVRKQGSLWNELFLLSNCILLGTSICYGLVLAIEFGTAWYSQVASEQVAFQGRVTGPYWYTYWTMIGAALLLPQLFWIRRIGRSAIASIVLVPFLNIGYPQFFEVFRRITSKSLKKAVCNGIQGSAPAAWPSSLTSDLILMDIARLYGFCIQCHQSAFYLLPYTDGK